MHAILFRRPARLLFLALAATLVLAACAGDEPALENSASFNDADTSFLESMIPHHAQAVEMAEMVADRTAHPDELTGLADTIISTQQAEIDRMNGLLTQAGAETVDPDADHGMEMEMSGGMMAPEEMEQLASLDGDAFDLRFLEMMTAHHRGAIEQAQDVLDQGVSPEVADLAQEIIDAQEAEIEQMQAWQEEWAA